MSTVDRATQDASEQPALSTRREWASRQAISFLMQQGIENADCLSLAAGLVDESSLPVKTASAAFSELMQDPAGARKALQYGTTAGALELRELLCEHLAHLEGCSVRDLPVDAEQIIATTGSQQLLSLIAEMLFDPGDICLVAAPTYFVFLGVLEGVGAKAIPVATDENGMRPDALNMEIERIAAAGELHRIKLIYLVSYFENPSGISLSEERRPQMLDIARRWSKSHQILILEDAAYRELSYDDAPARSIWGLPGGAEQVILAQTFSKSFSPGVRVGFGAIPKSLISALKDRKGNEDFGSSNLCQQLMASVLRSGQYLPHVKRVCNAYRERRDAMLCFADEFFGDLPGVSWVRPGGGLYVWMTLPDSIVTGFDSEFFKHATEVEKVMYVPGELCYPSTDSNRPRHQMRLSFGVLRPLQIRKAMQRLSNTVRHFVET